MFEQSHLGRRGAFIAVAALVAGATLGSVVPTAASAAGPAPAGPMVRLSVVPRTTPFAARQSAQNVLQSAGLSATQAGPAHPVGPAYQLDVPTSQLAATLSALRASGTVASVEPVHEMSLLDVP
jgi:hypothetical protein